MNEEQSGLQTGTLQTQSGLGPSYRDPAQQRAYEKKHPTESFGDDLTGRNGLSGVMGAIQILAGEATMRILANLAIVGDNEIAVRGSGLKWQVSNKVQPQVIKPGGNGGGGLPTAEVYISVSGVVHLAKVALTITDA